LQSRPDAVITGPVAPDPLASTQTRRAPETNETAWQSLKALIREHALKQDKEAHPGREFFKDLAHHESDVQALYRQIIADWQQPALSNRDNQRMLQEILDDTFGWGLIEPLMRDNLVTEVMVDAPDRIWYTRHSQDYRFTTDYPQTHGSPVAFENTRALEDWVQRLIQFGDRPLTQENPLLDDDLPGGARLQATVPPVTEYPTVNIRKSVSQTRRFHMDEWVAGNLLSAAEGAFLLAATRGYANFIICGPTGSGKTTLIRIMIEEGVDPLDRILLIEDIRETNADHPRFLSLRVVKRKNHPVTATDIFEAAMRKTPKRVFVSELRAAPETAAFLETIGSGHPGAITSQHGIAPEPVLNTMIGRAIQGGWGSVPAIATNMVYGLVHLLVFVRPVSADRRRVTRIVEVVPEAYQAEHGKFRDLFR
jgi:pilus assembly protein CpaF